MSQHIRVIEYKADWAQAFEEEKERLEGILDGNWLAIYHIGSTAVPGLAAKPIIDIMAVVRSLDKVDEKTAEFSEAGYEALGEYGIPGRRYLRKGGDERTHQLHIFQEDSWEDIIRHLAFRDYLRSHEKEREEYDRLKKELAQRYPEDIDGYCKGKDSFVRALEKKALACYDDTWDRLYIAARKVQYRKNVSELILVGPVAAALLTDKDNIYVGVNIDMGCSLGMCAERNAMGTMFTNGESKVVKILALRPRGRIIMPCGACREFMLQLGEDAENIEVLCDYDNKRSVQLKELIPDWWYEG